MSDSPTTPSPEFDEAARLKFHYIKSNHFRVIHVDGVAGGPTPRLNIQMALFNERTPIPQQSTYQLMDGSKLGDEIKEERLAREGVVREVDAEAIMDVDTARNVVKWLSQHIETIERIQCEREDNRASDA